MSRATQEETCCQDAVSPESQGFETRIDAAHPVNGDSKNSPELFGSEIRPTPNISEGLSEAAEEQLQRQAAQLGEYLRERQSELDHREAQLNAQIAQFESDARAARLWLGEREAERIERQQALAKREREIAQRLERLAAAEKPRRRTPASSSELNRLREQLMAEQRRFQEDARQQRERLAEAERQALAEVEKKRQAMQRRGEHLDRCRAALRQLRGELHQFHRETLEIRLATEELWIQLAGAAPPAALTHSLGQVRSRLAEQYRLERAELAEQKKELEAIREELAAQHEQFTVRKKQYEHWASARQEELAIQARRLTAREEVLEEQRYESLLPACS